MSNKVLFYDSVEESLAAEKKAIDFLGCDRPHAVGFRIIVALFVKDEDEEGKFIKEDGSKSLLLRPDTIQKQDRYQQCVGLVVDMGPDAYQDKSRFPTGPWCRVGDWVAMPRHSGRQYVYKNKVVHVLNDDGVDQIVNNPIDVTRY